MNTDIFKNESVSNEEYLRVKTEHGMTCGFALTVEMPDGYIATEVVLTKEELQAALKHIEENPLD